MSFDACPAFSPLLIFCVCIPYSVQESVMRVRTRAEYAVSSTGFRGSVDVEKRVMHRARARMRSALFSFFFSVLVFVLVRARCFMHSFHFPFFVSRSSLVLQPTLEIFTPPYSIHIHSSFPRRAQYAYARARAECNAFSTGLGVPVDVNECC